MRWKTTSSLRLCLHAICVLALAACATPPGGESADSDAAATPSAKLAKAAKTDRNHAAQGTTKSENGSWDLYRWGGEQPGEGLGTRRGSLDGLRADLGTFEQRGLASWYGKGFHGRKTANGERFDMAAMTAAHPTLPLDSWVLVRNLRNDKVAVLRINDRGPYHGNRVLDVSYGAARRLGFVDHGATQVEIRRLSRTELAALSLRADGGGDGIDGGGDDMSGTDATGNEVVKPRRVARKARTRTARRSGN